jgi:hypothetical protein
VRLIVPRAHITLSWHVAGYSLNLVNPSKREMLAALLQNLAEAEANRRRALEMIAALPDNAS